ncbi:MAG: glycoside hydrolase family 3 C-terminal domain-containing protein, partial [Lachnospiraceae bacterium]|nr:glycoside hydrolase family 3 C-terminal domain-containing protein [Lachnospiraceae bacterium]
MKTQRSAFLPLLVILHVILIAFTVVGQVYKTSLDRHFGYGKPVLSVSEDTGRDALYYDAACTTDSETLDHAHGVNRQISDEGIVLLKNNGALPLPAGSAVTPFGFRFVDPVYGGTGSGHARVNEGYVCTPEEGLRAHFSLNEAVIRAMKNAPILEISPDEATYTGLQDAGNGNRAVYELPTSAYEGFQNTCAGTTGIVFIGRMGGESSNYSLLPLSDGTPHVLALTEAERAAVAFSKQWCSRTVAVINSANVMEIGDLMQGPLECDAILWVGGPGNTGFASMGDILAGAVNPSGRTPDIWEADLLRDPAQANFRDMIYAGTEGTAFASNYNGTNKPAGLYYIEYEEGIYIGYRYYETAYALGAIDYGQRDAQGAKTGAGAVNYPFGWGLSYTTFTQRITGVSRHDAGNKVSVSVLVTNTGARDGKEVVQLYFSPPYTDYDREMRIEKSDKNLVAYGKVSLKAGESREVTLTFEMEDLASYCYTRENPDGTRGCWLLEEGAYRLVLGKDSHDRWDETVLNVERTVFYDTDNPRLSERDAQQDVKKTAAVNRFEDVTAYMLEAGVTLLSRADWAGTQPTPPTEKALSPDRLARASGYDPFTDPYTGNGGVYTLLHEEPVQKQENGLVLADMRGVPYDDPLWELFLDQADYEEDALWELLITSSGNTAALESLGKPLSMDRDGPQYLHAPRNSTFRTYAYCAEVMLAASFNDELAFAFGDSIGREALLMGLTGWYGPGLNLHRSAFCGRNFEYYSEDPLLCGRMGARCVSGAAGHGVLAYVKHFALNNYEGPATCLTAWATEQAIREIYLKSFEIVVK